MSRAEGEQGSEAGPRGIKEVACSLSLANIKETGGWKGVRL